jgi:hypothetical protein
VQDVHVVVEVVHVIQRRSQALSNNNIYVIAHSPVMVPVSPEIWTAQFSCIFWVENVISWAILKYLSVESAEHWPNNSISWVVIPLFANYPVFWNCIYIL